MTLAELGNILIPLGILGGVILMGFGLIGCYLFMVEPPGWVGLPLLIGACTALAGSACLIIDMVWTHWRGNKQ